MDTSARYRRWDRNADTRLSDMVQQGCGSSEIAETLGRTVGSVHQRISTLGLTRRRKWMRKEDGLLRRLFGTTSLAGLAQVVGRTERAVKHRCHALGLYSYHRRSGTPACAITGCGKPQRYRDWCATHYARWKRHGHPLAAKRPRSSPGTGPSRRVIGKALRARVVWQRAYGPIPSGYHIHHLNGDIHDDRLENLALLTAAEHSRLHLTQRWQRRR